MSIYVILGLGMAFIIHKVNKKEGTKKVSHAWTSLVAYQKSCLLIFKMEPRMAHSPWGAVRIKKIRMSLERSKFNMCTCETYSRVSDNKEKRKNCEEMSRHSAPFLNC